MNRAPEAKVRLREAAFLRRNRLSPPVREFKSHRIHERLCMIPEYQEASRVMLYASVGSEVVTWGIALEVLARGSRTYFPRIERGAIQPYEVASPAPDLLPRGKYRIPEPHPERCRPAEPEEIDLVLVPGVKFDIRGHRIGYGKGYFDQFLPRLRPGVPMLGLAYEMQMCRELPSAPWDHRVSAVVTEKETYSPWQVSWRTESEEETAGIGRCLGEAILEAAGRGSTYTIGLTGDLGAGKTCLVRGLAEGIGCAGDVSSPTFTLENEYRGGRLPVRHFDLYRLSSEPTAEDAGLFEEHISEPGVVVIEWAERWLGFLPLDTMVVQIDVPGETARMVRLESWAESQHGILERVRERMQEEQGIMPC